MNQSFSGVELCVTPTHDHRQWYLTVDEVAAGYGVDRTAIMKHLARHEDEFCSGTEKGVSICHTPGGLQEKTVLYQVGVIKLGFFIRSKRAAAFRQWASVVVCDKLDRVGIGQDAFFTKLNELSADMKEVKRTCAGLRDEIDELKEVVGLIFTDSEEKQIRELVKSVKEKTGMDGRAVVGHVRKTLNLATIYKSSYPKVIVNTLKNMIGQGLQAVESQQEVT